MSRTIGGEGTRGASKPRREKAVSRPRATHSEAPRGSLRSPPSTPRRPLSPSARVGGGVGRGETASTRGEANRENRPAARRSSLAPRRRPAKRALAGRGEDAHLERHAEPLASTRAAVRSVAASGAEHAAPEIGIRNGRDDDMSTSFVSGSSSFSNLARSGTPRRALATSAMSAATESKTGLVVNIRKWQAVGVWTWNAGDKDDVCGICRVAFDACPPDAKFPGDDSPVVWGQCGHAFHLQCITKWLNSQAEQRCPICRGAWGSTAQHQRRAPAPARSRRLRI